jgi:carboxyl-terminal processing protease
MRIFRSIILLLAVQLMVRAHAQQATNNDFEILKNLELFEMVYKQIDMNYVDEPNPGHLMRTAIDAMLLELDPYTRYIPESQIEEFKLMTTGQYGGIGALIQQQGDHVVISEPYEGWPAEKNGLRAGDIIIKLDDRNVENLNSEQVSDILTGAPGNAVEITVRRNGEQITKSVIREEIKLSPVPYYGMVNNDVGYIKFVSFTQTAGDEVLKGFTELKKLGMTKLIFDLRGNGGGLLIEAVKIVNMFVDKGETIVWMKGRSEDDKTVWTATMKPQDLAIPIVVLIDEGSASASEIVSGGLQDLDRAVILGHTSYGKGLVQRPLDLKYNARVTVTIAKYYTPSGRCIQKLDYTNRNAGTNALSISDSLLTRFKTRNGRVVIDGRGIEPDVKMPDIKYSRLSSTVVVNNIIFEYATQYRNEHPEIVGAREFQFTDDMYADFKKFVLAKDFSYSTASGDLMDQLKKTAEEENYFNDASAEFYALYEKLRPSKERDLEKFKTELSSLLEDEIIGRYYYEKGRIEHSMLEDPFILEAVKILNDSPRYKQILNIQG